MQLNPVFSQTVFFQGGHSNKEYSALVRQTPKGRFQVVARHGRIGRSQRESLKTPRSLAGKAAAISVAEALLKTKLAKGYARKLKAVVRGPESRVSLTVPTPKPLVREDARTPKVIVAVPKAVTVRIANTTDLIERAASFFRVGKEYGGVVEPCDRCKGTGKHGANSCAYCDGSAKQITITRGLDKAPTIVRRDNVVFVK